MNIWRLTHKTNYQSNHTKISSRLTELQWSTVRDKFAGNIDVSMPIVHHSKNVLKSLPFLKFPKITRSSKSNFLRATNLWHDRGKCISSPTTFCMQWLQKHWLRGVTGLVYLPVPMARWWELTLNFVKDRRVFIGRDIRYDFPFEKLVLNDALGCFTLLLAGHLADVSCYIGPHVPSGICMEIHTKIVHKRKKKPSLGEGILRQPHIY